MPPREAISDALTTSCATLDEDIVEYLVNVVLESAEDELPSAEAVRDMIGPFLEEQDVGEAAVDELSGKIAALCGAGTASPGPQPQPEPQATLSHDARADAQAARSSRRAKLAGDSRPLTPSDGRLATAVRIGDAKAASVDISARPSNTRADGSSAVNELIEVAEDDADDNTPLALAASSTSGAASRKGRKKGRGVAANSTGGTKRDTAVRMRPLVLPLQRLALCGGAHARLGSDCPLSSLPHDLLEQITQRLPQRTTKKTLDQVLAGERWAWMVFQTPSLALAGGETTRYMAAAGTLQAQLAQQQITRDGQQDAADLDDLARAWQEAGETGRKWGGRGFGGRGWLQNGQTESARDVILYNVTLSYAGKVLLKMLPGGAGLTAGQTFKLMRGHRYGFLGNNGCGKTTLLRRIASGALPGFPRHLRTLLVDQELAGGERNAIDEVVLADTRLSELRKQAAELEALLAGEDGSETEDHFTDDEQIELMDRLSEVLQQIDDADDGSEEKTRQRARTTLVGLGFTDELLERCTSQLSGGWRMRVALAKALFMKPDVLMLDEPTNHLDLRAVGWLEEELCKLDGTDTITMIVSHDRAFLAATATDIVEFSNQTLRQFSMDFDAYIETKRARAAKMEREVDNLEVCAAHLCPDLTLYAVHLCARHGHKCIYVHAMSKLACRSNIWHACPEKTPARH